MSRRVELLRDEPVPEIRDGKDRSVRPLQAELVGEPLQMTPCRGRVAHARANLARSTSRAARGVAVRAVDSIAAHRCLAARRRHRGVRDVSQVPVGARGELLLGNRHDAAQRVGGKGVAARRHPRQIERKRQLAPTQVARRQRMWRAGMISPVARPNTSITCQPKLHLHGARVVRRTFGGHAPPRAAAGRRPRRGT